MTEIDWQGARHDARLRASLFVMVSNDAYKTAYAVVKDHQDAEDIVADFGVAFIGRPAKYQSFNIELGDGQSVARRFHSWFRKCIVNAAKSLLQKQRTRRRLLEQHAGDLTPTGRPASPDHGEPAKIVRLIDDEVAAQALVLKSLGDCSYQEIIELLNLDITENALRVRIHRARERFKQHKLENRAV